MFAPDRRSFANRFARAAVLALLAAFSVAETACESTPIRAIRGARHYSAGTQALVREDGVLAIAELEQAADLVPHASEIQNHLGLAYWSNGREKAAMVAFEKAIELDCDNIAARVNHARLMQKNENATGMKVDRTRGVDTNGE